MYNQGEIVLIPFPYSDLTGSKKRPAIIISNSNLKGQDKICSLVTSNNPERGVLIKRDSFKEGKLPFKSWVKPERIFTVESRIIIKRIAKVNKTFFEKINLKIDYYLKNNIED